MLNRVVDANAAHRRHHVRRIADEQESRLVPARTETGLDGEERELLPVGQGLDVSSQARLDLHNCPAYRGNALSAYLLIVAFAKNEASLPIVGAVQHNENAARTDAAEESAGNVHIVRQLWKPEPENVHGRSGLERLDPRKLPNLGEAAVGAGGQGGAQFMPVIVGTNI